MDEDSFANRGNLHYQISIISLAIGLRQFINTSRHNITNISKHNTYYSVQRIIEHPYIVWYMWRQAWHKIQEKHFDLSITVC